MNQCYVPIARNVTTRSVTSATVLGDHIETCRAELLAALAPFFPDGPRDETLCARAAIYRRR